MDRFASLLIIPGIIFVLVPANGHRSFQVCRPKCPECPQPGLIALEKWQLKEIESARKRVSALKTNRTMTYSNTVPIVSAFTFSQKEQMGETFGQYFSADQTTSDGDILLWDETNPSIRRRKRGTDHVTRVCPVSRTSNVLVTVYDGNGNVLQVVQGDGHRQPVFRETCTSFLSPHTNDASCLLTVRFAYMVGFHVDLDNQPKHIQVHQVQIESCTSVMETEGPRVT